MHYFLELSFKYSSVVKRWTYDTHEEAKKELDLLSPLLGRSVYEYDKTLPKIHTINAKCGEGVVVVSEVQSAGIVNREEWMKAQEIDNKENIRRAKEWQDAGLDIKF